MKVFDYIEKDLDTMKFNRYGWDLKSTKDIKRIKKFLENANSFTLYDEQREKALAILSFTEYDTDKWYGLIIADECFGDNPKYAIKMKWLVWECIKRFEMKCTETESEDEEKLNKWHEFLGFKLVKKHSRKFRGRWFNLWRIEWE